MSRVGKDTGYVGLCGTKILMGDTVYLDGVKFEVIVNDFNGEVVIDGGTGQEELSKVAYMCVVDLLARELKNKVHQPVSDKFANKDKLIGGIWELRGNFVMKHSVYPNRVYVGSNLMRFIREHNNPSLSWYEDQTVFNMGVVEVTEYDHLSLGVTLKQN